MFTGIDQPTTLYVDILLYVYFYLTVWIDKSAMLWQSDILWDKAGYHGNHWGIISHHSNQFAKNLTCLYVVCYKAD